jgi:hypothetical protein
MFRVGEVLCGRKQWTGWGLISKFLKDSRIFAQGFLSAAKPAPNKHSDRHFSNVVLTGFGFPGTRFNLKF